MSRTRRLAVAVALVIGGTLAMGGMAYADATSTSSGSTFDGHVSPVTNFNQGALASLTHIKF
jgi:hypothetical protein